MALRILLGSVLTRLPEGATRDGLVQTISDFVDVDVTGILSERLSAQYLYDNMGGLDGPEEGDLERLQNVEAYNVIFSANPRFVVDRRSIYKPDIDWAEYCRLGLGAEDAKLVESALRGWMEELIMATRAPGSDAAPVKAMLKEKIPLQRRFSPLGATLKYGILHKCFDFPSLNTSPDKPMFLEFYAHLTNARPVMRGEYPYVHLWELEELHFEVRAMTYSDTRFLTVHMPGYA